MTNSMPTFTVLINGRFVDTISAVSYDQAIKRARKAYGRCEVNANGNVNIDRAANGKRGRNDLNLTHGRSRYPTPGFDARRDALVAAYKAANA